MSAATDSSGVQLVRVTKVAKQTGLTAELLRDMAKRGVLPARVDTGGRDDYFYDHEIWPAVRELPRLDKTKTDITKTASELATASSKRPTRTQQRRRSRGSSAKSASGSSAPSTTEGRGA